MPAQRPASKSTDAIAILTADHAKVKKLFKEFEKLHDDESDEEAEQVAQQICNELTIHATVEEEIFYPAVREATEDEDLMDEAEVEHASAKDLIAQIQGMSADDDKYAAKVIVLGEYIDHHVKEEQDEMFPKAKKAKVDMAALGEKIDTRKQELKEEMGIADEGDDKTETRGGARGKSAATARVAAARK
jgi:hemerythrin superfamily protein